MTTPHSTARPTASAGAANADGRTARFVRRHPFLTLMLVFNTFGQALVFVPVVLKRAGGRDLDIEVFQSISLVLFLFVPAMVITRFVRGPGALHDLLRSALRFRVPVAWYLVPLLLVPVGGVVFALSFRDGQSVADLVPAYLTGFLPSLAIQFLSTNWWEELVWMGVVQVPFQSRYGAFRAALLTTPMFAVQHVVLFADLPLAQALAQLAVLTVAIVFIRSFLAWQYNHTRSLAMTGLTHAAANATALGFASVLDQPVQGALAVALAGLVALLVTRGRLGMPRRGAAQESVAVPR